MPSLLSPTLGDSRSYTPLADEVNPPFGNHAPTVTRNGTVVYGNIKRVSSSTGSDDQSTSSAMQRSESEETLSPRPRDKGKSRAAFSIPPADDDEGGDIGHVQRSSAAAKGKGKERWDEEMGAQEVIQDNNSYPPVNSVEEDERRIQDNLAKFAARDMARRRAARLSRQMPTSPTAANASASASSSSTTSFMRRPFSMLSSSSSDAKRSSMMGMMGNWMGGHSSREELPIASPTRTHFNPYDPPAPTPAPRLVISPTSPTSPSQVSPFADPAGPFDDDRANRRGSIASSSTSPPLQTPIENSGYGYAGAQWRGGDAVNGNAQRDGSTPRAATGEKWWHALCSWGNDLDGGYDDVNEGRYQAGRTNPNE